MLPWRAIKKGMKPVEPANWLASMLEAQHFVQKLTPVVVHDGVSLTSLERGVGLRREVIDHLTLVVCLVRRPLRDDFVITRTAGMVAGECLASECQSGNGEGCDTHDEIFRKMLALQAEQIKDSRCERCR
jgi:hypothetical protein